MIIYELCMFVTYEYIISTYLLFDLYPFIFIVYLNITSSLAEHLRMCNNN